MSKQLTKHTCAESLHIQRASLLTLNLLEVFHVILHCPHVLAKLCDQQLRHLEIVLQLVDKVTFGHILFTSEQFKELGCHNYAEVGSVPLSDILNESLHEHHYVLHLSRSHQLRECIDSSLCLGLVKVRHSISTEEIVVEELNNTDLILHHDNISRARPSADTQHEIDLLRIERRGALLKDFLGKVDQVCRVYTVADGCECFGKL